MPIMDFLKRFTIENKSLFFVDREKQYFHLKRKSATIIKTTEGRIS